jgi:hypothetical protein
MKKLIVMISMLTALSVTSQSSMFMVGPSVGFGHAYMMPYSDCDFQPTWSAGITASFMPSSWWGLSADVRYSSEGGQFRDAGRSGAATQDIRLDYIRIPVKGIVCFRAEDKMLRPKLGLGPSFGILVNEQGTGSAKAANLDLGLNASAGINLMLNEDLCFMADINYYTGGVKVRPDISTFETNGNIGLNLGLAFAIPGRYTHGKLIGRGY